MDGPEAVEHLSEVTGPAVDILGRVVPIGDTKFPRCGGHELCKASSSGRTYRHWIEPGFGPDERLKQARGKPIARFSLPNEWFVKSLLE